MRIKLPELKLPTFIGEISEWLAFWSLFSALVHSRHDIGDTLKFTCLLNCLNVEPKELINLLNRRG